jgi:beta-1,4-mannooligosaccharide/beta-1,4-mannosyl-N-acetylglucosamine phosphorylase
MQLKRELLTRHPESPILTWRDSPVPINAVYNPGAARVGERYLLLPRVEDTRRDNRLHCAWSDDGVHFTLEPEPAPIPIPEEDRPFEYHQFDARITPLEGEFFIAYCAQGFDETHRIALAKTADFATFERVGFITEPYCRNCALFPERIGGMYARIDRMMSGDLMRNFVTLSPDLIHWGQSRPLDLAPQTWMRNKWGVGPPPIRTERGWLMIFHGVWEAIDPVYRLGVALLDREEPWRVIGQCPDFIMTPTADCERIGEVNNCIFANGAIVESDGSVKVYYGAADTCIGLATGSVEELCEACLR